MGQETSHSHYSSEQELKFRTRLEDETLLLKGWMREGRFKNSPAVCGYEAEGWIINDQALPFAISDKLLDDLSDPHITPELSKFNFEINGNIFKADRDLPVCLERDFQLYWEKCSKAAKRRKARIMFIGAYPNINLTSFGMERIYPLKRYYAINRRILALRQKLARISIKGADTLSFDVSNIMHESEATSLQIHLQTDFSQAKDLYNASLIASPIMAGLCANAPYVCGKELWEDSRIPLFEQVISLKSERLRGLAPVSRVGLGHGFVRKCPSELFAQNLSHPILLPELKKQTREKLSCLLFHNGTIWRWNRPIIGFDKKGEPHFRVEHRVPSAGPSLIDMRANILFFIGLAHLIRKLIANKPLPLSFQELERSFYLAARKGLLAEIKWLEGKARLLGDLIARELTPLAWRELNQLSISCPQADLLINDVIKNRARSGQNSAFWQRAFIKKYGKKFENMINSYWENQNKGLPVYQWKI